MSHVKVVVFDVNETLLDLAALDPAFTAAFGDAGARSQWFGQLLELFLTATIVDRYRPFGVLAQEAVTMVAERHGATVTRESRAGIVAAMAEARAHPDVAPALERLAVAGVRMAVLTNSTLKAVQAQLRHAGIDRWFESILSADEVHCYKPGRRAYEHAAAALSLEPAEIRLVAAHAWDIAGAQAAGCRTAFVARRDKAPARESAPPDIEGAGLLDVVERILAQDA